MQVLCSQASKMPRVFRIVALMVQDPHWQILVLVLMKALSLQRLQDTFESRDGLAALTRLLQAQDFSSEMFDALLEVLMEG